MFSGPHPPLDTRFPPHSSRTQGMRSCARHAADAAPRHNSASPQQAPTVLGRGVMSFCDVRLTQLPACLSDATLPAAGTLTRTPAVRSRQRCSRGSTQHVRALTQHRSLAGMLHARRLRPVPVTNAASTAVWTHLHSLAHSSTPATPCGSCDRPAIRNG